MTTPENQLDSSKMEVFPFQLEGIKFLKSKRFALLADEMGMGKSVQSIKAADELNLKNILIICMAVGRFNWAQEFEKWSTTKRTFSILTKGSDSPLPDSVVITSYDYLQRNSAKLIRDYDLVIFDEAHSIKNPRAARTKAALGNSGVIRRSKRIWFLSGTPAPNNYSEMWVMLYTVGITKLNYDDFLKRYCYVRLTEFGPIISGNRKDMIPEMKSLLQGFMLRRNKEKGMLPDILFQNLKVEPGKIDLENSFSFKDFYFPENRADELRAILKKEEETVRGLFEIARLGHPPAEAIFGLAQSVSSLRKYTGLQKIEPVGDIIAYELENEEYDKIVLFAIHRDVIRGLMDRLKKFNPVSLYGGMDDDKKMRNIRKFQTNRTCRVFIGNIIAAGTTINLTVANQVVFVEQDWVPGNNAQAAMRVHRIGQKKPVQVRFAQIHNSLDEKITWVIKKKMKELVAIFDDHDEAAQEISKTPSFEKIQIPTPPNLNSGISNAHPLEKKPLSCNKGNTTNTEQTEEIDIFS